jgi:hypothetical protein
MLAVTPETLEALRRAGIEAKIEFLAWPRRRRPWRVASGM